MTDSEIIKALRCCADRYCKGCSEQGKANCKESIAALSWDLINRQKEEIEGLKKANNQFADFGKMCSEIKSEARREFAERLKKARNSHNAIWDSDIDNLLKEMESES